jgi:uncharacterized membrane protein YebE (DUF533 family)
MFDAKSILEGLVRGAQPNQAPQQQGGGGLGDLLGEILKGGQQSGGQGGGQGGGGLGDILAELGKKIAPQGGSGQQGGGGGGLGDILKDIQSKMGQAQQPGTRSAAPSAGGDAGGGLGDILGQLKDKLGQAGGSIGGGAGSAGGSGSIIDVLGQILGQATQGAKEGATRIGEATGAKDALGRATSDPQVADALNRLKELVQNNPFAAGTAAGGLGGLVLGTRTGRSLAGTAARVGALALIGGLAYKAFQNYQAGKPLITGVTDAQAAPQGSGFEPAAVTNEAATLYIRAMIAAAAADGRIDDAEQAKVVASLKQAGVDAEAEEFLAHELNNPATPEDLANGATSPEEAIQIYTAARIAVEPDSPAEKQFLGRLAQALGIDAKLAAHIEATTRSASA